MDTPVFMLSYVVFKVGEIFFVHLKTTFGVKFEYVIIVPNVPQMLKHSEILEKESKVIECSPRSKDNI